MSRRFPRAPFSPAVADLIDALARTRLPCGLEVYVTACQSVPFSLDMSITDVTARDWLEAILLWLVPPLLMLGGSVLLWIRTRHLSTLLQVFGSIAFFVNGIYSLYVSIAVGYGFVSAQSLRALRGDWLHFVGRNSIFVALVFFPLGFMWYALRARRNV
jgi:hypothetical protein